MSLHNTRAVHNEMRRMGLRDGVKMNSRRKLEYFDGTLFTNKIEYYMKSKGIKKSFDARVKSDARADQKLRIFFIWPNDNLIIT